MAIQNAKKCIMCKRLQTVSTEGRIIDGTWFDDDRIPRTFIGKWVCCNRCYEDLVKKEKVNGEV
ncbi:MAG: hypothetical protein GOV00_00445 [Candidatus Altiarchaeota archaeon]|nr:hypothetical protein [Candidatus Altiarchaeota archaeon]